jgi:hypothetical protein
MLSSWRCCLEARMESNSETPGSSTTSTAEHSSQEPKPSVVMSRDGQSVPTPPSTAGALFDALLNRAQAWWLTGKTSTSQDSPKLLLSSEPLQIINDEKIFTSVLLACVYFSPDAEWQGLQNPLGCSDKTMGFARCRLQLQHSSCLWVAICWKE